MVSKKKAILIGVVFHAHLNVLRMLRHFAAHAHPWQSLTFQTRKSAPLSHDSGVNLPFCLSWRKFCLYVM